MDVADFPLVDPYNWFLGHPPTAWIGEVDFLRRNRRLDGTYI